MIKTMDKKRRRGGVITDNKGWKTIDVGDELLLGAEEAGFAGLEVLEDYTLLGELGAGQEGNEGTEQDTKDSEQQLQQNPAKKRQKKEKKRKASDIATLQAELKALKKENAALKASAGLDDGDIVDAAVQADSQTEHQQDVKPSRKQKQQNKRQKNEKSDKSAVANTANGNEGHQAKDDTETSVDISAWRMLALHPLLEKALAKQGFSAPTEIQAAVMPIALRDRADIIGAAQTGSGKTLAFGLPIMQRILQEREAAAADGGHPPHASKLRALVMAPTRELALQVAAHMQVIGKVASIRVVAIVGGLAHVKQERLLKAKPDVVVATPGRLWELLRDKASPHLSDMSGLTFLVLDEADKMVQKGHFQELSSILALVPRPGMQVVTYDKDFQASLEAIKKKEGRTKHNKGGAANGTSQLSEAHTDEGEDGDGEMDMQGDGEGTEEDMDTTGLQSNELSEEGMSSDDEGQDVNGNENDNDVDDDLEDEEQLMSDVEIQSDSDREADMEAIRKQTSAVAKTAPSPAADSALGKQNKRKLNTGGQQQSKQDKSAARAAKAGQVQTMVFSATLTLPANLRKRLKRGGGGALGGSDLENLMDTIPFRGTPHIVDLSGASRLATGVSQAAISCLEGTDKDTHLYYLLLRHPGRALVFVNAVSALRRVAAILKILNLPAFALHAQQQQRQRLKALDRFKAHSNAVLVATDVAARGLDIQDVRMVVHYQLPASADTYIHRCGRTARAGGEGVAVALVSAAEAGKWKALCRSLLTGGQQQQQEGGGDSPVPAFPVDVTLMPAVVARIKLAAAIDDMERAHRKTAVDESWQQRAASEAGLDEEQEHKSKKRYDDDDDDQLRTARLDKAKAKQLAAMKQELAAMISQPLAPRMSRGFFTGGAVSGVQLSDAAARGGASQAQDAGNSAAAVSQAVALANKIIQAKQRNKTAAQKKPKKVMSVEQLAKQQLLKRQAAKAARRARGAAPTGGLSVGVSAPSRNRKGLVVIPPSQSRDLQGQDALAALKRKIAVIT